jgi:hypothetical protein
MSANQRKGDIIRALSKVLHFIKKYPLEIEISKARNKPRSADLDQKYLGTTYEAENTRDLAKRQVGCRHPSYAVHYVSWAPFITNHGPKIQEKVLEKEKDAFILSNVLSETECETLIHLSERHGYVMMMSAEAGGKGRTNTRILTQDETLAAMLFERMKEFLPHTYQMTDGRMWNEEWVLDGLNERFRWCKYVEGQSFKNIHCDKRVNLPKVGRHSFFTVNIYLNGHGSNYRGGRTIFYDQKGFNGKRPHYEESSAFAAQTGEVMVFNHFPQEYPHCGETLSSGTKYLLRSDVMYKKRKK